MKHDNVIRKRTFFSDQFKRSAVLRLRAKEQTAASLAFELGIRRNQLYKWAKEFDQLGVNEAFRAPGRPPAAAGDVAHLQRALKQALEEIDILKKFDAYLTARVK